MGSGKEKAERKNHLSQGFPKRGKRKPSVLKWSSVWSTKDSGVDRLLPRECHTRSNTDSFHSVFSCIYKLCSYFESKLVLGDN